jgi:ADP-ribose pyrophosphatase
MKWKVLKSRYIAKDPPWFTTRVDTVQLPSGEVLENYYVLEYPDWVIVLAITDEDKFVFVEQYRHALGCVSLELSAGVVDETDESLEIGAKRELLEETGYGGGEWSLFAKTSANPGTHTNTCYTFLAKGVKKVKAQELDRTEDINVKLFSKDEVLELLKKDEIIQSMHSTSLWKWLHLKNYR